MGSDPVLACGGRTTAIVRAVVPGIRLEAWGPVTAENEPRERRRGRTRDQAARTSALPDQRPFAQPRLRLPPLEVLSADQVEAIHQASLRILRDLGMRVLDPETRGIYEA